MDPIAIIIISYLNAIAMALESPSFNLDPNLPFEDEGEGEDLFKVGSDSGDEGFQEGSDPNGEGLQEGLQNLRIPSLHRSVSIEVPPAKKRETFPADPHSNASRADTALPGRKFPRSLTIQIPVRSGPTPLLRRATLEVPSPQHSGMASPPPRSCSPSQVELPSSASPTDLLPEIRLNFAA